MVFEVDWLLDFVKDGRDCVMEPVRSFAVIVDAMDIVREEDRLSWEECLVGSGGLVLPAS